MLIAHPPVAARSRVHPLASLAVGVGLYLFLPALLIPVFMAPVDAALRALGLLAADASDWERGFAVAMVLRWLSVPLLLLYVAGVERLPLSSLGVRRLTWRDAGLAVVVGLSGLVVGEGLYLLVHGPGVDPNTQLSQILGTLGIAGRVQVALNAAVVEELFFRGLLIERLLQLGAGRWASAGVSLVLFVGSHYLTGSSSLVLTLTGDLAGGVALVAFYMLRQKLPANMLAHVVLNAYVVRG